MVLKRKMVRPLFLSDLSFLNTQNKNANFSAGSTEDNRMTLWDLNFWKSI